jgi:hypothetical protein
MVVSVYSLAGLFLGLLPGFVLLAAFYRYVYPRMRFAHERAKLTATQGVDPSIYALLVRIFTLLILPGLGFVVGHRLIGE